MYALFILLFLILLVLLIIPPERSPGFSGEVEGVFLKETSLGDTLQPHNWSAIAERLAKYKINTVVVEAANIDSFFAKAELPNAITAFHTQNIKVHVLMKAPSVTLNTSLWQRNSAGNPVYASGETSRAWTCPTNPASIAQALSIVDDVLSYDIDGFMLDYIRYPESRDACFCNYCKTAFETYLGHTITDADFVLNGPYETQRLAWRTQPINEWVRTVSARINATKPSVEVSAAVFQGTPRWDPKVEIGQDGYYWVTHGYLDFIAPMIYIEYMLPPMDINIFRTYAQWIRNRYAPHHEIPMVPFIETRADQTVSVDLFAQTCQVIQEPGINADGFVVFKYGGADWQDWIDIEPYLNAISLYR
jgi:uncharacterized lipoprotein YddW (UPF0748 family)